MRKTRSLSPPPAEKIASPSQLASVRDVKVAQAASRRVSQASPFGTSGLPATAAPSGLRATSMRRPARVKLFFLVVPFVQPTADQREALLAFSLSFIERFLFGHRDSRSPTSGGAQCAIPNFQITDSPYFHPHSLWSYCSGASWVSSNIPADRPLVQRRSSGRRQSERR